MLYMESKEEIRRQKKKDHNTRYQIFHFEEICERRKERITCECGLDICKRHLRDHMKKSRHQKLMQQIEQERQQ
jgi:hypothetical protein